MTNIDVNTYDYGYYFDGRFLDKSKIPMLNEMNQPSEMEKYGVQITQTEPSDDAYCVYQLIQKTCENEYKRSGSVVWIDKSKHDFQKRLMKAVLLGLQGKIKITKNM